MVKVNPSLIKANRNINKAVIRGRNGIESTIAKNLNTAASVTSKADSWFNAANKKFDMLSRGGTDAINAEVKRMWKRAGRQSSGINKAPKHPEMIAGSQRWGGGFNVKARPPAATVAESASRSGININRWGGNFNVRARDAVEDVAENTPGFFSRNKGKIAMGAAAIGAVGLGSEVVGRFMSEDGDLTHDRDGKRDILGVPFI